MAVAAKALLELNARYRGEQAFKRAEGQIRRVKKQTLGATAALKQLTGAFLGVSAGAYVGVRALQAFLSTSREVERSLALLRAASGGDAIGGEAQFAKLVAISNKYGRSIEGAALQYGKMLAAARASGIPLRDVEIAFEGVAAASSAMALSAFDTELSMQALVQIISKGTVQMEELRRQLAERFPGALGIIADAMQMTTEELNELVRLGKLSAAELFKVLGPALVGRFGKLGQEASILIGATEQKFVTAMTIFNKTLAEVTGFAEFYRDAVQAAADATNYLSEAMGSVLTPAHAFLTEADGLDKRLASLKETLKELRMEAEEPILGQEARRRSRHGDAGIIDTSALEQEIAQLEAIKRIAQSGDFAKIVNDLQGLINAGTTRGQHARSRGFSLLDQVEQLIGFRPESLKEAQKLADAAIVLRGTIRPDDTEIADRATPAAKAFNKIMADRAQLEENIAEWRAEAAKATGVEKAVLEELIKGAEKRLDDTIGVTKGLKEQVKAYQAIATYERMAADSINKRLEGQRQSVVTLEAQMRIWRTSEVQFEREVKRLIDINNLEKDRAGWIEAQLGLMESFGDITEEQRELLRDLFGVSTGTGPGTTAEAGDSAAMNFVNNFRSGLRQAILSGRGNIADAFASALQATIIDAIFDNIAWDAISSVLGGLLTSAFSGIGSALGGVFGSLFGGGAPAKTASGGGAQHKGRPVLVGEFGPEIFVPSMNGQVYNASQARGMGGVNVTVNNSFSGNVRSDADLQVMADAVKTATVAEVQDLLARGRA